MKKFFTVRNVLIGCGIVILDIFVYMVLGLLLMHYEDFYDSSKGPYESFGSMTTLDKITSIGIMGWNVINVVAIVFVIYKMVKALRRSHAH